MDYTEYRSRVSGCFTGKAVGGTLGMPFEGNLETRVLTGYDPVPTEMVANDDLDLQVIDLELIRAGGLPVNRYHLSALWDHLQDAGPDEYGCARWNVALKRYAPLSGYYCNAFHGGMGAAIRSELWACLAPGDPALAVRLAREDACTDHYGDGMEACVFLTAVESAAFTESDARKLIETGLAFIPPKGRLAQGIRDSIVYLENLGDPYKAREAMLRKYGVQNWTDVTINLCIIVIAWLSACGEDGVADFDRALCTAGGLGYDADCTCATLGSILGIMDPLSITAKWTDPIGDSLVLSCSVMGVHEPETIDGFCDLVAATAAELLPFYGSAATLENVPSFITDLKMHAPWTDDPHAVDNTESPCESLIALTPLTVRLLYPETVALEPEKTGAFTLVLRDPLARSLAGEVAVGVPEGWTAEPSSFTFSLNPRKEQRIALKITSAPMPKRRPRDNDLTLTFTADGLTWTVTAGLALTIPWYRENLDTGEASFIEAPQCFQSVPRGRWRYTTVLKVNPFMPVRMGAFSRRPLTASLNGREVIRSEGGFYVPAYHRGKTTANVTTDKIEGQWNIVEIEVADGDPADLFFGLARPHNCCEWLIGAEYANLEKLLP